MDWKPVARWVSMIGHPFVWLLVYVGVAAFAQLSPGQALWSVGIVLFVSIVPMTFYLQRLVRSGSTNFDVSHRELRGPVYLFGLGLGLLLLAIFRGLGTPWGSLRGLIVGIALVVVASLINRRLKVSMHSAFAVWVAVGLWPFAPVAAMLGGLFALVVVWSRLELERHTAGELVAGTLLGALMAIPLLL